MEDMACGCYTKTSRTFCIRQFIFVVEGREWGGGGGGGFTRVVPRRFQYAPCSDLSPDRSTSDFLLFSTWGEEEAVRPYARRHRHPQKNINLTSFGDSELMKYSTPREALYLERVAQAGKRFDGGDHGDTAVAGVSSRNERKPSTRRFSRKGCAWDVCEVGRNETLPLPHRSHPIQDSKHHSKRRFTQRGVGETTIVSRRFLPPRGGTTTKQAFFFKGSKRCSMTSSLPSSPLSTQYKQDFTKTFGADGDSST